MTVPTASDGVTPERIMQFVWAFAPPLAIEVAVRHRVFDVLAAHPLTIDELVRETGASVRGLSAIADVLIGLDLLARDEAGRYRLTPESDAFLVSHHPAFVGGIFRHMSRQLLPNWLHLNEVVGTGKPVVSVNATDDGVAFFGQFVEDIYPMSYASARMLADVLALAVQRAPVSVLDLAAGTAQANRGWVAFTHVSALYQLGTAILSVAAFFSQQQSLNDLALIAAVVGMPVFAAIWLVWMLHDINIRIHKEHIA